MMIVKIKDKKYKLDLDGRMLISGRDIEELETVIHNCFSSIIETDNIRVVALETWMLIEYFVRQALESAFSLSGYKCENLDPKYDLLPSSFGACLDMLEKLLCEQKKLPQPPTEKEVCTMSAKLVRFYHDNYPDIINKMMEIEEEYNQKNHPELYSTIKGSDGKLIPMSFLTPSHRGNEYYQQTRFVNSYQHMDEDWFKGARKINNIRNIAAHRYVPEDIYKGFGYSGSNAFSLSKEFCLDLITKLCWITVVDDSEEADFEF